MEGGIRLLLITFKLLMGPPKGHSFSATNLLRSDLYCRAPAALSSAALSLGARPIKRVPLSFLLTALPVFRALLKLIIQCAPVSQRSTGLVSPKHDLHHSIRVAGRKLYKRLA